MNNAGGLCQLFEKIGNDTPTQSMQANLVGTANRLVSFLVNIRKA